MKRTLVAAFAAVVVAGAAFAKGPGDYAQRWPVVADGEGAYAITLTPEVYAHLHRPDLADLAAFDSDGAPLAFGPLPPSLVREAPTWRAARWFALPAQAAGGTGDLSVHATRNAAGELTFDATVSGTPATPKPDLLIDVRPGKDAIDQLDLELAAGGGPINAQFQVLASDDLQSWTTLLSEATVARLEQGGEVLERRIVELPATGAAYLRLVPVGAAQPLPLASVRVRAQPAAPTRRLAPQQWLDATFVRREGNTFFYALPSRIPAQRLDIVLGDDNAIDRFAVSSREGPTEGRHEYWTPRGELTAFRLRGAGVALDNQPLEFGIARDREWKLEAGTDLANPPKLRFGYHPETWLLLTHGKAPYSLAAGSERATRANVPIDALFAQVQARYGGDWNPPEATLGAMAEAGGAAALAKQPDPERNKQWLLWGILLLGALAIVAMVFKLLREKPAAE
jgi:hypothetical protein